MPGPVFLHTDDDAVALRTVEEEDLPFLQRNWNDPDVRRLLRSPTPRNGKQTDEAFEEWLSDDDSVNLLVSDESDGGDDPEPVGTVSLFRIDEQAGVGTLACWITPDAHGEGYATLATEAMVAHAFDERRLHKVVGEAYAHNTASRRVLEKVGLREEGVLRDEKFVDGDHVDVHRYGLLADEWA
jgi:RimJ/RimL family protein N-acetyltransferase